MSDTTCDGDGTENEACNTDACPVTSDAEDCSVGKVSGLISMFYVIIFCPVLCDICLC